MTEKRKEIFDRITEIRDRMEDAKCEMALLRQACEQLKQERDAAIQRVKKAEAREGQLRKALEEIRDERKPQVCSQYEECDHTGCEASYAAFVIADIALIPEENKERETSHV